MQYPAEQFLQMSDEVEWPTETYQLVMQIQGAVGSRDWDSTRLLLAKLEQSGVLQGDALNPISRLELLATVANAHSMAGNYPVAEARMQEVCDLAIQVDPNNVKTALDYQALAGLRERRGDHRGALDAVEAGIRYLRGVRGFTESSPYYTKLAAFRSRLLGLVAAEGQARKRPWWAFWRKR